MKPIPLTQGMSAFVDDDDYEILSRHKWYFLRCSKNPKVGYAVRNMRIGNKKTLELMHRVVLALMPGQEVDHVDRNTLNNTRANLRICTRSQNQCNRALSKLNNTGVKGVGYSRGRFVARVYLNSKVAWSKSFKTVAEATEARIGAVRRIHGEFARL